MNVSVQDILVTSHVIEGPSEGHFTVGTPSVIFYGMNEKMTMKLAGSRIGRIVLHAVCAMRDHKWQWHFNGILREVR